MACALERFMLVNIIQNDKMVLCILGGKTEELSTAVCVSCWFSRENWLQQKLVVGLL